MILVLLHTWNHMAERELVLCIHDPLQYRLDVLTCSPTAVRRGFMTIRVIKRYISLSNESDTNSQIIPQPRTSHHMYIPGCFDWNTKYHVSSIDRGYKVPHWSAYSTTLVEIFLGTIIEILITGTPDSDTLGLAIILADKPEQCSER